MLDPKTIEIIKSTVPAIAAAGPKLTAHFYDKMLNNSPELKDIFNLAHQGSGAQREALFNAVAAYATNLENLGALGPAVEKIAQKHASLLIKPEQYDIVGSNLLETIKDLLNPGDEVIDAWAKAYGVLAKIFIDREEAIYKENEAKEGGWRGTRDFKIVKKEKQSDIITSFELEPVDGLAVASFKPGQYIGLFIEDESFDNRQVRQYSISKAANGKGYRIAIKREDGGIVSNHFHDKLNEGSIVKVTPPVGDFFLEQDKVQNVCLLSAGVGITPMLCMLNTLADNNFKGKVTWIHGAHSDKRVAFTHEVAEHGKKLENFKAVACLTECGEDAQKCPCVRVGHVNLNELKDMIDTKDTDFFMCGPISFMQDMAKQLLELGVSKDKLHYEVFGPHKVV